MPRTVAPLLALAVLAAPGSALAIDEHPGDKPKAPSADAPDAAPTIVNGTDAEAGEFPFVAALAFKYTGGVSTPPSCSATLIHPEWLLTAAHCVGSVNQGIRSSAGDAVAVFGKNAIRINDIEAFAAIDDIEVHPDYYYTYQGRTYANTNYDIALLHLAEPFTEVVPAVVNDEPIDDSWRGTSLMAVGFGRVSNAGPARSGVKRYAELDFWYATDSMFRTLDGDEQNLCNGDSGGGTFEQTANGLELAGVNSIVFPYNAPYDYPCDRGGAGLVRVDAHLGWVRQFVEPATTWDEAVELADLADAAALNGWDDAERPEPAVGSCSAVDASPRGALGWLSFAGAGLGLALLRRRL